MYADGVNATSPTDRPQRVRMPLPNPRKVGTFGMLLFLASLTMLFAATMIGYILLRLQLTNATANREAVELGWLQLPAGLWLSTFVILASSVTLHLAGRSVALERQRPFRRWMVVTSVLAALFVLVQLPSLYTLIAEHRLLADQRIGLYGLVFFLIIVHAAHVLGGVGPLWVITAKAFRGKYDHENYVAVQHLAMYWHFLDIVWLVMFGTFLALG